MIKDNDLDINQSKVDDAFANAKLADYCFINGETFRSENTFSVISPIDNQALQHLPLCDCDDVENAVNAARDQFVLGEWSLASLDERKTVLKHLIKLLQDQKLQLAVMETLNTGRPISDTIEDMEDVANDVEFFVEAVDKVYGKTIQTEPSSIGLIINEPIGVVGIITPWNFPLAIAVSKLLPAIIMGNCVVIKPSEYSPHTIIRFAELCKQAGVPDGVVNVVTGDGTTGNAIALHDDINCLTFTGSTFTGKQLLKASGQSNLKPVLLELGGKSANVVLDDVYNIEEAVEQTLMGFCYNQGQVCSAVTRLVITPGIYDKFLSLLKTKLISWQPKDPRMLTTKLGPLVSEKQLEKIKKTMVSIRQNSSLLITSHGEDNELYFYPKIVENCDNNLDFVRQEIFGPILSVIRANSEQNAIDIANDSEYGLVASLWTSDLKKAHRYAQKLRVGRVSINGINSGGVRTPFGGYKASGNTREGGPYWFSEFVETKTIWVNL